MSHEPPSIRDELDRKALENLQFLVHSLDTAQITKAQYDLASFVLWNVTAGLVCNDVSEAISAAKPEQPSEFWTTGVLTKDKHVVAVSYSNRGRLRVVAQADVKIIDYKDEVQPCLNAKKGFVATIQSLSNNGYKLVA